MKSEAEIKFDFEQAKKCAKELENVAADIKKLADNDIQDSLQEVSAAWTGEAAKLYLKKGATLQEKILANAKNIEKTASTIRSTAKRIYDAEMRALEIARERSYKSGGGGSFGGR